MLLFLQHFSTCRLSHHRARRLVSGLEDSPTRLSREGSKTGRQADRQTQHADRRTETHSTRLGCSFVGHNIKIYLNFPKYGTDHKVFIAEREFVGVSYTGIHWLYLIIKVRLEIFAMCAEMETLWR